MKEAVFIGSSYKDLIAMPDDIQDEFGYAIDLAQAGKKAPTAKPFKSHTAAGVFEVVEDYDGDTYRALYSTKIGDVIYALHCFQKKSPRKSETPKPDMETLDARLKVARAHAAELATLRPKKTEGKRK